jgi:hypothetical protein
VTPEAIIDFLNGNGALTATWTLKHRVLTGLYRFAVSRGYVDNSPLPRTLPKLPPQQTPYVYSTDELRRLLDATAILSVGHSRKVPAMYRTLLLLLYGSGMRIGEALRLNLQDVDLVEMVITVRCTKFFKTRLVPIGPKLTGELTAHIERRSVLPMPNGKASPLFASRGTRGWSYPRVISMFQHVRRAAGIECPVGDPRRVVLVGQGRPEERHDPIPRQLADRTLVAMDRLYHVIENRVQELVGLLGIALREQLHRTLHVGEEDRDLLPLALKCGPRRQDAPRQMLGGVGSGWRTSVRGRVGELPTARRA